jgi:hypothetical protein
LSCSPMELAALFAVAEAAPLSSSARVILLCVIGLLLVMLGFLIAMALIIRRRPAGAAGEAPRELLVCPTCRRPYEAGTVFCPVDARRLIPATKFDARATGGVCSACKRGFDPGLRFCPHDATELVPATIFEATRGGGEPTVPTGVIAKICPQCRSRHDLSHVFCGKDGVELVAIN